MSKIKLYLFLLAMLLVVSGVGLAWILSSLSPAGSGPLILFYTVLLLFGFSAFALAGFYLRRVTGQREWQGRYLFLSARQGLWLALILTVSMFLLSQGWFNWFNGTLLVLIFSSLEAYLFVKNDNN